MIMKKEREYLAIVQQSEEKEKTYSERLQQLTKVRSSILLGNALRSTSLFSSRVITRIGAKKQFVCAVTVLCV
jgi:hypothetical protein